MSEQIQHTPGPWFIVGHEKPVTTVLCGDPDDPEIVCYLEGNDPMLICNRPDGTDYDLLEANARLIAAAPDLLTACEAAVLWISLFGARAQSTFGGVDEMSVRLRAAIAKRGVGRE